MLLLSSSSRLGYSFECAAPLLQRIGAWCIACRLHCGQKDLEALYALRRVSQFRWRHP